ncbi:MAG: carbohydrate binding domain-containing protein [Blastocatellia bacterium]|nr:carbohydrate binding domain-containing protein [Chloracidobacterium sp.]MBL8186315.1 carbohydrate binding domain-containing protein [Blastocatellia bacterium]HBE83141.1 hypothetical protein [Blastocatellia bacterium]HRJ89873.1 carbohydrate binding domain-containing protein [Pyrinomonadaceae bacterium]HRK50750.1 carbohydrate binding domain-containing protein [Pyrinomonadaceae bacterium]
MNSPLIILETSSFAARATIILTIVIAILFVWFGVRWQIGNLFAEITQVNQPDAREIAELAVGISPSDPFAIWLLASKERENFGTESFETSTRLIENIVRIAPNDFRWWIELGRAYEQTERPAEAERALLRAVELAPAYTFPRWQLGNFYLRQRRTDEAFAELIKTTEKSSVYREQVFALAWDYFGKDPSMVEKLAGDAPDIRSSLAMFYAVRGAAADALRNWNLLSEEQKAADPRLPRIMAQGLYDKLSFREALEFAKQAGIDPEASIGAVSNGGFEKFLGSPDDTLFGWNVYRGDARFEASVDSGVKREGARSLKVTFKGYIKPELHNVVQIIAVESGTDYRLTFWVRTENLRSGGPPILQVTNMNDGAILGATEPFANGTSDWEQKTIDFTVPADCTGISIRTARTFCGGECPIAGTFWYDDFALSRR